MKERAREIVRWLKDKCIDHDTISGRAVVIMTALQAQDVTEVLLELLEADDAKG